MIEMRSKVEAFSKAPHIIVYREDLLELESIMKNGIGKGETLKIKYEDTMGREHSVSTLENLDKLTKLKNITFSRSHSSLNLNLRRTSGASFFILSESKDNYSTILEVLALLSDCRSKSRTIISKIGFPLGFFLVTTSSLVLVMVQGHSSPNAEIPNWEGIFIISAMLLGFVLFGLTMYFDLPRNSFFTLSSRNSISFFKRNKDRILTGLITGLLVALVSVLLTKILS